MGLAAWQFARWLLLQMYTVRLLASRRPTATWTTALPVVVGLARGNVASFMMYSVTLFGCMLLAGRRQNEGRLFTQPRRCPASVQIPASLIRRIQLTGHRSNCGHLYPGCQSAWLLNNRCHDYSAPGLLVPWTIRSQNHSVRGLFGPGLQIQYCGRSLLTFFR